MAAARAITDRLDFLRALHKIIYERDVQARVLERSRLHRFLATETWLFGEQHHQVADDESLTNVLRRHSRYLDRDDMGADTVTDEYGRTRIVDLMLGQVGRRAAQHHTDSGRDGNPPPTADRRLPPFDPDAPSAPMLIAPPVADTVHLRCATGAIVPRLQQFCAPTASAEPA